MITNYVAFSSRIDPIAVHAEVFCHCGDYTFRERNLYVVSLDASRQLTIFGQTDIIYVRLRFN